jgi:hypothetical protein
MERTIDADTQAVGYTFTRRQLVLLFLVPILLGLAAAAGGNMYFHHNEQHWNLQKAVDEQKVLNQQFVNAINQLAAQQK